ncbi:hypothetical protein ACIRRA_44200 [Nocardia sp. NPDC101769]|uniref:hypothetical protein n=1 Tax=Nocardia sp. NPDC101769 TaxID=3364333 RepID=UPI00381DE161
MMAGRAGIVLAHGRRPDSASRPHPRHAPAGAGNQRLHHRWEQFTARKKRTVVANVTVARELARWRWSLATIED